MARGAGGRGGVRGTECVDERSRGGGMVAGQSQ